VKRDEIKLFVAELLNEGLSLSDIQKKLQTEKDVRLTFLDLRLLASELEEIDWSKQKADVEADKNEKFNSVSFQVQHKCNGSRSTSLSTELS
jgi:hypothetical protein